MAIDRRLLINIDWGMMGAVLLLLGIGVATILSATYSGRNSGLEVKQVYWILIGLVALLVCVTIDYRRLVDHAPLLYLASVVLLTYVLFMGPRIAGTRRWVVMGPVQIQPSEFVKLAAALFVAKIFAESKKDSLGIRDILGPGAAVGVLAGLRLKAVLVLLAVGIVVGGLGWEFALKDYQKTRIYTFLDPSLDPRGAGYQKIQSEIAVGSGGIAGKGYKKGTQAQLGYLPARHTDFIFSVLAEENGFVGVVVVLGLYLFILWRAMDTAQMARDRLGAFLAAGVATVLAFQVVYNIAMVAGLVPVKGLPLPLMSYGGSSIISSLLAVGLILNVRMRRFVN